MHNILTVHSIATTFGGEEPTVFTNLFMSVSLGLSPTEEKKCNSQWRNNKKVNPLGVFSNISWVTSSKRELSSTSRKEAACRTVLNPPQPLQ